jgi:cell fate (sporulation/competence/biofilm development) regulator YlbF (YheA/YmcA/DUF963 family)
MVLPEELKNAAQALGRSLRQNESIAAYLEAVENFRGDPDAVALENQLLSLYNELMSRQQAGEQLSHEEVMAFRELRTRVQIHPVISKRENELRLIKPHLVEIAEEISLVLEVDYTTLAHQA